MLRKIGAVIAGIVAALAAIWLVSLIGNIFYPLPSDLNIYDRNQVEAMFRDLPFGAQIFAVAAWFLGALAGGAVAGHIARARWAAWSIASFVTIVAVLNVLMIPHPAWMQIGAVVAPVLGGLVAVHTVTRRARPEEGHSGAQI